MLPDDELETWRRQWQAHAAVPRDLRMRVERQIRAARFGLAAAIAVTIVFGVGSLGWAIASGRTDVAVLAVGTWVFLLVNWFVSLALNRGGSRPLADTAVAYLDFAILSCRRQYATIAAGAVLYVAMLVFVLVWKYHEVTRQSPREPHEFLTSASLLVVWAITAALALLALWRRRRLRREMHNLLVLREHVEAGREP